MEQLTLVEKGRVEWQEVPEPRLEGDGEALVEPLAVTRCDIDTPYVTGFLPPPRPFALGHECVGRVVAIGDAVRSVREGDRVIVPFQISCGDCARCRAGHTGSCESVPFLSSFGLPLSGKEWGGALSGRIRIPFADAMLVRAPAGVEPWQLAAVADNACDGWRCVAGPLRAQPAAPVLIVAGIAASIAIYAAEAARALGAPRVDLISQSREILSAAERVGANAIEAAFEGKRGPYPITVDASGDPAGLRLALRSTDLEGICTSPAFYPGDSTPVPLGRLYTKGIVFHTGRCHARPLLPEVAEAVAQGRFRTGLVASRRAPWQEAAEAMVEPGVKLVIERAGD